MSAWPGKHLRLTFFQSLVPVNERFDGIVHCLFATKAAAENVWKMYGSLRSGWRHDIKCVSAWMDTDASEVVINTSGKKS